MERSSRHVDSQPNWRLHDCTSPLFCSPFKNCGIWMGFVAWWSITTPWRNDWLFPTSEHWQVSRKPDVRHGIFLGQWDDDLDHGSGKPIIIEQDRCYQCTYFFHCRVCFLKPSKLIRNINKCFLSFSWVSFAWQLLHSLNPYNSVATPIITTSTTTAITITPLYYLYSPCSSPLLVLFDTRYSNGIEYTDGLSFKQQMGCLFF